MPYDGFFFFGRLGFFLPPCDGEGGGGEGNTPRPSARGRSGCSATFGGGGGGGDGDAGGGDRVSTSSIACCSAAAMSSMPPVATLPLRHDSGFADSSNACRRSAMGSFPPVADTSSAAAPDTNGAAMDVPLSSLYEFSGQVERMPEPGAARCTVAAPTFE